MHDIWILLVQTGHHFINSGMLDISLLFLGFGAGLVRARGLATFLRISIVLVRMAKWYFQTHPHGKAVAQENSYDEKLTAIYQKDLAKHDSIDNTFRSGSAGTIPAKPMRR